VYVVHLRIQGGKGLGPLLACRQTVPERHDGGALSFPVWDYIMKVIGKQVFSHYIESNSLIEVTVHGVVCMFGLEAVFLAISSLKHVRL